MTSNTDTPSQLEASVLSWRYTNKGDPYTGNDDLKADIQNTIQTTVKLNGLIKEFDIWHLANPGQGYYGCPYVIRAELDTGIKSKNPLPDNEELFITSKGKPWTDDRSWTYLLEDELRRRSNIAGLGRVTIEQERRAGHRLYLGIQEKPLVENGTINEEIVTVLAKMLVVMYSGSNPV